MAKVNVFVTGFITAAYPALEPFIDAEVVEAGEAAANFVADKVESTDTLFDNEGAEKLEKFLLATGNQLKARREAFAAGQTAEDGAA